MFLRPTITRTPDDVQRLMEREMEKIPGIRAWERELQEAAEEAAAEAAEAAEEK